MPDLLLLPSNLAPFAKLLPLDPQGHVVATSAGTAAVVAVNPGATETDRQVVRWKALAKEKFGDENRWRELTTGFPMGRLATLDEVGSTIVFLCSERSGYTSGCVVTIDGGASWRP